MRQRRSIYRLAAFAAAAISLLALLVSVVDPDGLALVDRQPTPTADTAISKPKLPHHAVRAAALPVASVTMAARAVGKPVPPSYFGISTEYWTLPLYARHLRLFERVLSLLHVPGTGPMILRIGGDSADHTFWDPQMHAMPPWAFRVGPSWLKVAGLLVRRDNVRLILDLNLVTGSSPTAATWAQAAKRYLPPHSIVGFEIGNEPDIYSRWNWLRTLGPSQGGPALLPRRLSAAKYISDFREYAHALARVAPDVPLAGPALAHPALNLNWLSGLIAGAEPGLGMITAHRYPYSACVRRSSVNYPSIPRILADRATVGLARMLAPAVRLSDRAGLPFRLTELNSVTCGGVRGISDTFATALWAPDALFELLRAGVGGVNVHVRANPINAAFAFTSRGLVARPLLYGLLLFSRSLGAGGRLVPLQIHAQPSLHLKAWAVRVDGLLHVLLIDKGDRGVRVDLRLPGSGPAFVQRLLASSARARSGVTLAGQQLDAAGKWQGLLQLPRIPRYAGAYQLALSRLSAALVNVQEQAPARPAPGIPGPARAL